MQKVSISVGRIWFSLALLSLSSIFDWLVSNMSCVHWYLKESFGWIVFFQRSQSWKSKVSPRVDAMYCTCMICLHANSAVRDFDGEETLPMNTWLYICAWCFNLGGWKMLYLTTMILCFKWVEKWHRRFGCTMNYQNPFSSHTRSLQASLVSLGPSSDLGHWNDVDTT